MNVLLSGRVQGVAFRFFAEKRAAELGLTGWVRNLYDGRVEITAEGPRNRLETFLDHMKAGPRMARIDRAQVTWSDYTGEFPDFRVIFSGW